MDLFRLIFNKEEMKAFDWEHIKLEKDSFPEGLQADLIYSVPLKKSPKTEIKVFILLEHKSQYDIQLFRQLYWYQTGLIGKNLNETGNTLFIMPLLIYHGKSPWKWKLSFQEALGGKDFLKIPVLSRKSMLDFKVRLLDVGSPKLEEALKSKKFKSRGALYLLREVWSGKKDLAFVGQVFDLFQEVLKKRDDVALSVAEYLSKGYKVSPEIWRKAEAEAVKKGLLKKGGFMDIRKHIEERGRQKGWRKGLKEGRQEVVLNMLKEKADIDFIQKVTGISEKEIKKLKNGN